MNYTTNSVCCTSRIMPMCYSLFYFFVVVAALSLASDRVIAQQAPNLTPDQLQQLQQMQGRGGAPTQTISPQETILEPNAPPNAQLPTSRLEQILSARAGVTLKQFGYDQLGSGRAVTLPQMGAVQDDYVLGPGDEIIVSLRGQENSEYRVTVDRDGRVVLPRLNPVSVAGRTFGDFRQELISTIHKAYVSTDGFVTVGRLRQISVLVSGEVGSPGVRTLTGLSTAVDAILVSGGVKKTGSLRNIRILRGGREITVDLYSVLTGQARSSRVALADGDRIVVPPVGVTVAVAGETRRPGIYELPPGRLLISVHEALAMASQTTVPGVYTVSLLRMMPDGKRQFVDVTNQPAAPVRDGEIIFVKSAVDISLGRVNLAGAVRTPGAFALHNYPTLHDLIPSVDALQPGAYMLFGFIDRIDPKTLQRAELPFSPLHVIQGGENLNLLSDDTVHVLTKDGMRSLLQKALAPRPPEQQNETNAKSQPLAGTEGESGGATGTRENGPSSKLPSGQISLPANATAEAIAKAQASGDTGMLSAMRGAQTGTSTFGGGADQAEPASAGESDLGGFSNGDSAFLGNVLGDYRISLSGAVHEPGDYLVAPNTTLAEALIAAGGLDRDVDLSSFEITSTVIDNKTGVATTSRNNYPANSGELPQLVLKSHDDVKFRHSFSDKDGGAVTIDGEVRYPGTYNTLRGEHLSSVLIRAGGLTDIAYPYGTVFLRRSAAAREQDAFQREGAEIEDQLLVAMSRRDPNSKLSPDAFVALQGYVNQLKSQKALGRVSVAADPAVLAANPAMDPILEPGDSLYVPRRPFSVAILGEVLQPGSVPFGPDMSASDYINRAGGYSQFADKSETILVLPDGSARRVESSWFNFGDDEIPPGSTIYVARDISGIDLHQIIIDTTQIFSQLATTAAALAVLSKQ